MAKSIIAEGKTTNEAIEKGLKELNVSKNKVDIKVIEEKKKTSFFDILTPNVVKVELTIKENVEEEIVPREIREERKYNKEEIEKAKKKTEEFIKDFVKLIDENAEIKVEAGENEVSVTIEGENSNLLIGYRGDALNSLQTILRNIANKGEETNVRVVLDIGNYRDSRRKTLEDLANKLEKTVLRTGKKVTLEPMTPYERKIIHTKLQESTKVKTYSVGEGDRRRLIVEKK